MRAARVKSGEGRCCCCRAEGGGLLRLSHQKSFPSSCLHNSINSRKGSKKSCELWAVWCLRRSTLGAHVLYPSKSSTLDEMQNGVCTEPLERCTAVTCPDAWLTVADCGWGGILHSTVVGREPERRAGDLRCQRTLVPVSSLQPPPFHSRHLACKSRGTPGPRAGRIVSPMEYNVAKANASAQSKGNWIDTPTRVLVSWGRCASAPLAVTLPLSCRVCRSCGGVLSGAVHGLVRALLSCIAAPMLLLSPSTTVAVAVAQLWD
jgi:hypothetical protein